MARPGSPTSRLYSPDSPGQATRFSTSAQTSAITHPASRTWSIVWWLGSHVEPNPTISRLLQRTVQANSFWAGAHINNLALSDRDGTADMTVYEDMWGGARLQQPDDLASSEHPWARAAAIREQFEVPTTTVDKYCGGAGIERIDLLKIDVEGHEEEVVAGMQGIAASSPDLKAVLEFTFGAYANASSFWATLSAMFSNRYAIRSDGTLTRVNTIDDLRAETESELVNVALANRSLIG